MKYNAIVYIKDPDERFGVLGYAEHILKKEFNNGGSKEHIGNIIRNYPYRMVMHNPVISYDCEYGMGYGMIDIPKDQTDSDILNALQEYTNDLNSHINEQYYSKYETVNCGFDKEMFKYILHMNDDTDYNTPFVERNNPHRNDNIFINTQWKDFEKDCNIEWCKKYIHKAKLEDIIELSSKDWRKKNRETLKEIYLKLKKDIQK